MRTAVRATFAIVSTTGLLAMLPAVSATAVTPTISTGASAYSAAAGTGMANLHANLQLSGSLGKLLDALVSPIVSQDLNPLVAALQGSVNGLVTSALGASSGLNASTSPSELQYGTAPAGFPNDALPSPCVSSGSQPCYTAGSGTVSGAPLTSASVGAPSGYVEQVVSSADGTNPIFGRASAANVSVSLLSGIPSIVPALPAATNPLVSATAVGSKATCPNDGAVGATKPTTAPSASAAATSVSLLGGLVTFNVASGQIASLRVNNVAYVSVLALPTVSVAGGVTIAPYGSAIQVSIPLSLDQVLAGLGLSGALVTALHDFSPTSTVALTVVVGPNTAVTSRTASAWGLGIGADLSGSLTLNLLNLVTANISIPTGLGGSNYGNLLDLRLAYSTCQSGVILPAIVPAVPPALV
jgi:hypothetical protein